METEQLFHATALSNFALGFDKYTRLYDKSQLPRCSYPGQFFLLQEEELDVGLEKAAKLVSRLGLPGNAVVVMRTEVHTADLHVNTRTGLGRFIAGNAIEVTGLFIPDGDGAFAELPVEEALARAIRVLSPALKSYEELVPRTFSVLPIARACQARCQFCFSEASVSLEQEPSPVVLESVSRLCEVAKQKGAKRFVITGGGEPGLLPHRHMLGLMEAGRRNFDKVVLITNGIHLSRLDEVERASRLDDYERAGLNVLALSRHHFHPTVNARIMGVDTRTERVLSSLKQRSDSSASGDGLRSRLICVLQRGGIDSLASLSAYLDWATSLGVEEVCFKELYVSTTLESAYHAQPENQWSLVHQVPLSLVLDAMFPLGFSEIATLPWGAPVFEGTWRSRRLRVAAYTEPSLFWERTHGIARSWNMMADGSCLASLEDPGSKVFPLGRERKTKRTFPILPA